MKFLALVIINFISVQCIASENSQECIDFISANENYKKAHLNKSCQLAALDGNPSIQYSIGMGYGYEGLHDLEEEYYRLAANSGLISAYLTLGHTLSKNEPWEAIYWYQRYYYSKVDGYGYAAFRIVDIFEKLNKPQQVELWWERCLESPYQGCKEDVIKRVR
ncbi:hypothetical protein DZA50_00480 [Kangiella sp. HD9-110m-PIT-SAG07]|nr:hypothetical protein DZA50_00480 [Kangiella sp. HD9-110m-PIT-SAG07]